MARRRKESTRSKITKIIQSIAGKKGIARTISKHSSIAPAGELNTKDLREWINTLGIDEKSAYKQLKQLKSELKTQSQIVQNASRYGKTLDAKYFADIEAEKQANFARKLYGLETGKIREKRTGKYKETYTTTDFLGKKQRSKLANLYESAIGEYISQKEELLLTKEGFLNRRVDRDLFEKSIKNKLKRNYKRTFEAIQNKTKDWLLSDYATETHRAQFTAERLQELYNFLDKLNMRALIDNSDDLAFVQGILYYVGDGVDEDRGKKLAWWKDITENMLKILKKYAIEK